MRRAPIGRSVLAGALALLAATPVAAAERAAGTVSSLAGTATVSRSSLAKPASLAVRDDLFVRDRISIGRESLLRVLLGGRTTVTARELSVLTITDTPDRARVALDAGGAALDVTPVRAVSARPLEVRTPNAIAAVRGTVLTVEVLRLPGKGAVHVTTVSVFAGSVDVMASRVPAKRVRVGAGQSVVVTGDVIGPVRPLDAVTARRLVSDFELSGAGAPPLPGAAAVRPPDPGGVASVGITGSGPSTPSGAGGATGGRSVGTGSVATGASASGAPSATGLAPTSSTVTVPLPTGGPGGSTVLPAVQGSSSSGGSGGAGGAPTGSAITAVTGTGAAPTSSAPAGASTGGSVSGVTTTGSASGSGGPGPAPATAGPASIITVGPAAAVAATPAAPGATPGTTTPEAPGLPAGGQPGSPSGQGGGGVGVGGGSQGGGVNPGLFQPQPGHQVIKGLNPNPGPVIK